MAAHEWDAEVAAHAYQATYAAQGFFAAQGFLAAQGFFAAHGLQAANETSGAITVPTNTAPAPIMTAMAVVDRSLLVTDGIVEASPSSHLFMDQRLGAVLAVFESRFVTVS